MAVEYIEAAYRLPDLSSTECLVLAYLANRANERGECWPTRRDISERCRLHVDTVKTLLQGLDRRGLLRKEDRFQDGRRIANKLVLTFVPYKRAQHGNAPPSHGVVDPRSNGDGAPQDAGGSDTPEKKRQEQSPESPRKPPKGGVTPEARALAEELWAEAPKTCRQRSGQEDVARACNAALEDRRADPEQIKAALHAYWREEGGRDEGQHLKGLHRMIQQDRWREWIPESDAAPAAGRAAGGPQLSDAERQAIRDRAWRTRLEDYRRIGAWNRQLYGPEPEKLGCQVPQQFLAEFGFGGR